MTTANNDAIPQPRYCACGDPTKPGSHAESLCIGNIDQLTATLQVPDMPVLPQHLIDAIGKYGYARTDGCGEVEIQHRWETLIQCIKVYAAATHAGSVISPVPAEPIAVSETMIDAYLSAQASKVKEVDDKWGRGGKAPAHLHPVSEACRAGLVAALSASLAPFRAGDAPCATCNGVGLIGGWTGGVEGGYDSEPCPECNTPSAIRTGDETPLSSKWRYNNGVICNGSLRIMREDFDTPPSDAARDEIMAWVIKRLNADHACDAVHAATDAPLEHKDRLYFWSNRFGQHGYAFSEVTAEVCRSMGYEVTAYDKATPDAAGDAKC